MRVQIDRRRSLETELRRALERAEFTLFYQPILTSPARAVQLRGPPALGASRARPVAAREFLQLAEETGLVVPIGGCVLEMAAHRPVAGPTPD